MTIRSPQPATSHVDTRRTRRQISWLVFLLGLVGLAAFEASKPENWFWLTGAGKPGTAAAAREPVEPDRTTGSPRRAEPLPPDQVRIVAADAAEPRPAASSPPTDSRSPLDPAALATIRDDVVGIRRSESDAWFQLLTLARDTPPQVLAQQARSDVSYAALMSDPDLYRGQLLALKGEVRRLTRLPAGENDAGFEMMYDGWMFTADAGKKSPYRVICSEKPPGFPEGETIREPVQFVGYFFKRVSYETAHGLHSAPMLLGYRFEPIPIATPTAAARHAGRYVVWGLAMTLAAFVTVLWRLSAGDRRLKSLSPLSRKQTTDAALAPLPHTEPENPAAFLSDLARQESDARSNDE